MKQERERKEKSRHLITTENKREREIGGRGRDQEKGKMRMGFAIGVVGILTLFHAAYSTIQYRGLLKIMEEEFSGPPIQVAAELAVGLVLCMWAALTAPGKFLSILPQSDDNRIVALPANMDFMIFNHRGKICPPEAGLKLKD